MKYFTIKEFEKSDSAKKLKINNTIPVQLIPNIEQLVNTLLDPIREVWGSGINITSGYRSPMLNKAIGGVTTSAHCFGLAADLVPVNGKLEEFKAFVLNWLRKSNIPFDQYIDEQSGNSSWVHIGFKNSRGAQRKQYLLYRKGKYTTIK